MALKIKSISGIEDVIVSFADSANNVPATGIYGLETSGNINTFVKDDKLILSGKDTDLSDYYNVDEINEFLDEKQDVLNFEYNNDAISAINGSALAIPEINAGQMIQINNTIIDIVNNECSAIGDYSIAVGSGTIANGINSYAEGQATSAQGAASHAEGNSTIAIGKYAHAEGYYTSAIGSYSHAEGVSTSAIGENSHAEGSKSIANIEASHAEGMQASALSIASHAEGYETYTNDDSETAWRMASHAEGYKTSAINRGSHAEGSETIAYAEGGQCHAEGYRTSALGNHAHVEGQSTIANGVNSHAQGYNTVANYSCQCVMGQYNVNYIDSVLEIGWGTAGNRKTIFRVDQTGNLYIAGNVITGSML